jgi:hypothetical protein
MLWKPGTINTVTADLTTAIYKAKYPNMSLSLSPPFNRRRNLPSYRGRCSL